VISVFVNSEHYVAHTNELIKLAWTCVCSANVPCTFLELVVWTFVARVFPVCPWCVGFNKCSLCFLLLMSMWSHHTFGGVRCPFVAATAPRTVLQLQCFYSTAGYGTDEDWISVVASSPACHRGGALKWLEEACSSELGKLKHYL
jgi:hypothetical protein